MLKKINVYHLEPVISGPIALIKPTKKKKKKKIVVGTPGSNQYCQLIALTSNI